MSPKRLRQVEELFHLVHGRPPEEQMEVLARADLELRREVESLLAQRGENSPLDHPTMEFAAPLSENSSVKSMKVGEELGPYKIEATLAAELGQASRSQETRLGRSSGGMTKRPSILHYDLQEEVGRGGMGVVYRAHDKKLNRAVALKFLSASGFVSAAARTRLLQEARAISQLSHRHIAVVHAIEENDNEIFLVFEYLSGGTLRMRLQELRDRHERMRPELVATYGLQIAEALAHAHASGIIHRDVKPANLMFASNGDIKIVDFGISKWKGRASTTETGSIVGTPMYMSPEQARGKNLDERSDVFSLGVVLYEMAAGTAPFVSNQVEGVVHQIINQRPRPIKEFMSDFPFNLDEIIMRALEKPPAARYQRSLDLADDLRCFLGGLTAWSEEPPTKSLTIQDIHARRKPWLLSIVALFVISCILLFLRPMAERHRAISTAAQLYNAGTINLEKFYLPENIDKAISDLQRATKFDSKLTAAFAALSEAYRRKYIDTQDRHFMDLARSNASKALELDHTSAAAHVASGVVLAMSGDRDNAIAEFRRAISADSSSVEALRELATAYSLGGNTAEAERLYQRAVKLRPKDWDTWSELGIFHNSNQNYSQAVKDFTEVISLAPDNPAAHRNLGAVYLALGNLGAAESEFRVSITLRPTGAAYSNLGALYIFQGRYNDAIGTLIKAIELTSSVSRKTYILWGNLAEAYRYSPGHTSEAVTAYKRAIQEVEQQLAFRPDDAELLSYVAVYRANMGDQNGALDEIARAMRFASGSRNVSFRAALVYELTGRRDRALAALADAIRGGYSIDEINKEPTLDQLRLDRRYSALVSAPTPERLNK